MKKKFLSSAMALSLSFSASAASFESGIPSDWGRYIDTMAATWFSDGERNYTLWSEVATDRRGVQRFYFEIQMYDGSPIQYYSTCYPTDDGWVVGDKENHMRERTWKVGGQNIRMNEFCYDNGDRYEWSATPLTDKGEAYVVQAFKSAPSHVYVTLSDNRKIKVSAKGFTKVWNNAGGDAL